MFEAGALVFRIQSVGQAIFKKDQADAKDAFDKTGKAAEDTGRKVDESGNATDRASKKARDAKKPLDEQASSTKKVGDESATASDKQDKQKATTEQQAEAAKKLSAAMLVAGVAVSALVGLSVAKFVEFDKQMSNTSAATMASAEEQRALGEAALDAGADTAYSASEAAAAEEELAKAGLQVSEIVGGSLNGALALAAAGQLQVARSAEIMATTLKQYKLPAEDAAHVSDLLAAGSGKAQGSVDDLANALKFVGPVAAGLGISLEETTGILALFAEQGIIGEQAGTSLRGVLSSLTSPSKIAADTMKQYGIEIFNANGEMKSGAQVAQELQDAFGSLTEAERSQALGRIFGNEQITTARILYSGGAAAVEEWTDKVNDSGYAAEQAAMRQDNLAGDVEKLGGAFDTALIRTGSGANEVLREMVQSVTALVDWYGELPAPIQATALVVGVATAAVLLLAGSAVGLRVRFMELKAQMDATNTSMGKTALVGAAAGLALTGVVTVLSILAQKQAEMNAGASEFADTLDEVTGAATENTRALIAKKLADQGAFEGARQAGISQKELTEALYEGGSALDDVLAKMNAYNNENPFNAVVGNSINSVREMGVQLEDAEVKHQDLKAATDENAASTESAADAYVQAADEAAGLNSTLQELIDTIAESNGVGQDAVSANIDFQEALFKVDEQIRLAKEGAEGYSLGLEQNTEAGRDNLGMLNDLAGKSQEAAEAQFALDGNTQTYRSSLEAGRQALIQRAEDLGYNATQAQELADQIFRIPSDTEWKLIADTSRAAWTIQDFINKYGTLSGTINYRSNLPDLNGAVSGSGRMGTFANGGVVEAFASGGMRENHVAQMARAGSYRLWAEPETGGESYIPHAPSKRARSEALMTETAAILGGVYIPSGASQFAAGGMAGAQSATLDSAVITGTFEIGDGFVRLIDGRIQAADTANAGKLRGGRQVRG